MPLLLLATNNPGKIGELRSLLASLPALQTTTPEAIGLRLEVEESGQTYAENASLKALAFARASGLPALADDSGLEVDALAGRPGLHSARMAATAAGRRKLLLTWLEGQPRPWKARFRSTLCLALPSGALHVVAGECDGEISPEERGSRGFGYDPIFIVGGTGRTMAELTMQEKNRLSHRARAVEKMLAIIQKELAIDYLGKD